MTLVSAPLRSMTIGVFALILASWSANAQESQRRALSPYPGDSTVPAIVGAVISKRYFKNPSSQIDIYADFLDLARFLGEADELRGAQDKSLLTRRILLSSFGPR
jgi:hypothetical protein